MGLVRKILIFFGLWKLLALIYVVVRLNTTPPMPQLDPDPYWGPGARKPEDTKIRPFSINIPDKDVDDLKARLALSPRFAPPLEGANFTYGVDSTTMAVILKHWKDNYDWKKREKRLNAYKHFKTRIEGLDIHFMRASPPANSGKTVRPLLILNGWPSSFVECLDIFPLLTAPRLDSEVVFDAVCPSFPGHAFSEPAAKPGMHAVAVGQVMTKLMKRLGFHKYYVHGESWGSRIAAEMATVFPNDIHGVHITMVNFLTPGMQAKIFLGAVLPSGWIMAPENEKTFYPLSEYFKTAFRESGYSHIQITKPDTLGIAFNSSPVGLAAYILEKFSTGTALENVNSKDGGLLDPDFPISMDSLLDNICIYWFTGSMTSSMRLYAESYSSNSPMLDLTYIPTSVPAGIARFPNEILMLPENFAKAKLQNLVSYTSQKIGGHFAAFEEPKLLIDDFFQFTNIVEHKLNTKAPETKTTEL